MTAAPDPTEPKRWRVTMADKTARVIEARGFGVEHANPNPRPGWRRSTRENRMSFINPVSNDRPAVADSVHSAPLPEIEITSEMVEAGKNEIARVWLDFTSADAGPQIWGEVLSAVFRAMLEARPSGARATAGIASPRQ
jgi:hypothetical protein